MMVYIVGINHETKTARLASYESEDLWSRRNPDGFTQNQVVGQGFDVEFEHKNKAKCLKYIRKNYRNYFIQDLSYGVFRQIGKKGA